MRLYVHGAAKMRSYSVITTLIIVLTTMMLFFGIPEVHSVPDCDPHDQSSLLQLKHDLVFDPLQSELATWDPTSNCCAWSSVTCSVDGHVTDLNLGSARISGVVGSDSPIFDLQHLRSLDLSDNAFNGTRIGSGIGRLVNLLHLRLSDSGFGGQVPPEISTLTSLQTLDLSRTYGPNLRLESPRLSELVRNLTSLTYLKLDRVDLSGSVHEWSSLPHLEVLSLSACSLSGTIPSSVSNLTSLTDLNLSYNNFTGTIDLGNMLRNLSNLTSIDLSFNALSVVENGSFPSRLDRVRLASCGLGAFPSFLRHQHSVDLDLSYNALVGEVPTWIWTPDLGFLDLSHNSLTGFERPLPDPSSYDFLMVLDLSSNLLQGGEVPLPPPGIFVLDYSDNNFHSIPSRFWNYFTKIKYIQYLSLSNNDMSGTIPLSLCSVNGGSVSRTNIDIIIDLSLNKLTGTIPGCLVGMNLKILNLKGNLLDGNIPDAFQEGCSLQTIDFSGNQLRGTVPESMANCKALQVLNLGSNELSGGFPCWLMQLLDLRVLVLRSNNFFGHVTCALSDATKSSTLQIIDIAANGFGGELPYESFKLWTSMKTETGNIRPDLDFLGAGTHYHDTVVITSKGVSREFVKILKVHNAIDFSCNHFEGSIPGSIGELRSLFVLNLSHNHLEGEIPSSLGNLKAMESLDLANNELTGVIPEQLTSLNFLSYLNLSFNELEGRIPTSTQLQSFSEWSYAGNKGLYGPPLTINCANNTCEHNEPLPDPPSTDVGVEEISWQLFFVDIGYVVGLGAVIASLALHSRWRKWYFEYVDRLIFRIFPRLARQSGVHAKRRNRKQGRQ